MSSQLTRSPPQSTTNSPSPRRPITGDDKLSPPSPPSSIRPELPSGREDCWSEEATRTLIDAWGSHYLQLNRGNLRQKHWQEVADAVNALHAHSVKLRRTDVQCKNRIDTTKKKYKIEKSKIVQSKGRYVSSWAHFQSLDSLIGDLFSRNNGISSADGHTRTLRRRVSPSSEYSSSPPSPPEPETHRRKSTPVIHLPDKNPAMSPLLKLPWSVPVGPRSKRTVPRNVTERNFSVMAAAAAAAMEAEKDDDEEEDDEEEDETWGRHLAMGGRKRRGPMVEEEMVVCEGYQKLAEAIGSLAHIYQKVEEAKQQQMVELEKQRMQFAKDLEIQRMKVFMESQIQLEKVKRAKRRAENRHCM